MSRTDDGSGSLHAGRNTGWPKCLRWFGKNLRQSCPCLATATNTRDNIATKSSEKLASSSRLASSSTCWQSTTSLWRDNFKKRKNSSQSTSVNEFSTVAKSIGEQSNQSMQIVPHNYFDVRRRRRKSDIENVQQQQRQQQHCNNNQQQYEQQQQQLSTAKKKSSNNKENKMTTDIISVPDGPRPRLCRIYPWTRDEEEDEEDQASLADDGAQEMDPAARELCRLFGFIVRVDHRAGVYVHGVKRGSAAHLGGLRDRDRIHEIDGVAIDDTDWSVSTVISAILGDKTKPVTLLVTDPFTQRYYQQRCITVCGGMRYLLYYESPPNSPQNLPSSSRENASEVAMNRIASKFTPFAISREAFFASEQTAPQRKRTASKSASEKWQKMSTVAKRMLVMRAPYLRSKSDNKQERSEFKDEAYQQQQKDDEDDANIDARFGTQNYAFECELEAWARRKAFRAIDYNSCDTLDQHDDARFAAAAATGLREAEVQFRTCSEYDFDFANNEDHFGEDSFGGHLNFAYVDDEHQIEDVNADDSHLLPCGSSSSCGSSSISTFVTDSYREFDSPILSIARFAKFAATFMANDNIGGGGKKAVENEDFYTSETSVYTDALEWQDENVEGGSEV